MSEEFTLESGQRYRTRDGKRVVSVIHSPSSVGDRYPFVSRDRYSRYTVNGLLLFDSVTPSDLVTLVPVE